jgi:hypothetical protein
MSKFVLGMLCKSCHSITKTLTSVITGIGALGWDDIEYNYGCVGFRILDLNTLDISDYSVKDVVTLNDSILNVYPFSSKDIHSDEVRLTIYGCTEEYLANNHVKNGKFDSPTHKLPIIPYKTSGLELTYTLIRNKPRCEFVIVHDLTDSCCLYIDLIKKCVEIVLLDNVVYRTNKSIDIKSRLDIFKGILFNYKYTAVYEADIGHLYNYIGDNKYSACFDTVAVVNLFELTADDNLILPNTIKKVIIDSGSHSKTRSEKICKIVIPPNVSEIELSNKEYFKNVNLILYIPNKNGCVNLINSIFLQLNGKSILIFRSKDINKLISDIEDKHNIEIVIY